MQWDRVEPLLRATYVLLADQMIVSGDSVLASMDPVPNREAAGRAFMELDRTGYIEAAIGLGEPIPYGIQATERGLQYCAGWPAPGATPAFMDALLQEVDQRIVAPETPDDQRGRLRRFAEAASAVGSDLLSDVMAKVIEHQAGL